MCVKYEIKWQDDNQLPHCFSFQNIFEELSYNANPVNTIQKLANHETQPFE